MIMSIFGVRKLNFTAQDGKIVKGRTVFVGYEADGVDGMMTEKIYLSDDRFGDLDIIAGADYDFSFDRRGKVETVTKA